MYAITYQFGTGTPDLQSTIYPTLDIALKAAEVKNAISSARHTVCELVPVATPSTPNPDTVAEEAALETTVAK